VLDAVVLVAERERDRRELGSIPQTSATCARADRPAPAPGNASSVTTAMAELFVLRSAKAIVAELGVLIVWNS
jgi:hypothetical protein